MPPNPRVAPIEARAARLASVAPISATVPVQSESANRTDLWIALFSLAAISTSLMLEFGFRANAWVSRIPLLAVLVIGGGLLLFQLIAKALTRQFGSDLLAGVSIITATLLGEYLVGAIIVLMLSGGTALEQFASRRASSALAALARRQPQIAHKQTSAGMTDLPANEVQIGDRLVVFPHELCPVDGVVVQGSGQMNEAYLTGEPFEIAKAPGSAVLSGAVNGAIVLTIRATKLAVDSRFAQIMKVMEQSEASRPPMRRIADRLGAWYTPAALTIATIGGLLGQSWDRFLAVVVIATPCPLLIAIPVAIIGAISLCARNGIIIKNAAALENVSKCKVVIFDKTGTLTYGRPILKEIICGHSFHESEVLQLTATLEQYSKHPLAGAILKAAKERGLDLAAVQSVSEEPGQGLRGMVSGKIVEITGRTQLLKKQTTFVSLPPQATTGLECIVLVGGIFAAVLRFADEPRAESSHFVRHLRPHHGISRVMLLSGDRQSEVENLARITGIGEVHAGKSPEEKVHIVAEQTCEHPTLFVGDGLNDAPAMKAATVGLAFGQNSDITAQAADAVILDPVIRKVDELIHIGQRTRTIALQSAVGGMLLSIAGMFAAMIGYLPPLEGAIAQEIIDVAAVLNALRVIIQPKQLADI